MKEPPELDITTFLNLMVVLIPFLLISAVFSRVAIMELSVPTGAGAGASDTPNISIEVIVRKQGFELANGAQVVAAIPKKDDDYDMDRLTQLLIRLKADYPDKEDATILMEPDIEYDYLIRFMDRVRSAEIRTTGGDASTTGTPTASDAPDAGELDAGEVQKMVLFPSISIGDAP